MFKNEQEAKKGRLSSSVKHARVSRPTRQERENKACMQNRSCVVYVVEYNYKRWPRIVQARRSVVGQDEGYHRVELCVVSYKARNTEHEVKDSVLDSEQSPYYVSLSYLITAVNMMETNCAASYRRRLIAQDVRDIIFVDRFVESARLKRRVEGRTPT